VDADVKDLLRSLMREKFDVDGYDPLVRAVELAESNYTRGTGKVTASDVIMVHLKVAEYWHAKKRSVQLSDPRGETVKIELVSKIKAALD